MTLTLDKHTAYIFLSVPIRFKNAPSRRFADHAPINYLGAVRGVRTGP